MQTAFALAERKAITDIEVLGPGCAKRRRTLARIEQAAHDKVVPVTPAKVAALRDITGCGIPSAPGVLIDGRAVHAGGAPGRDRVEQGLAAGPAA